MFVQEFDGHRCWQAIAGLRDERLGPHAAEVHPHQKLRAAGEDVSWHLHETKALFFSHF